MGHFNRLTSTFNSTVLATNWTTPCNLVSNQRRTIKANEELLVGGYDNVKVSQRGAMTVSWTTYKYYAEWLMDIATKYCGSQSSLFVV